MARGAELDRIESRLRAHLGDCPLVVPHPRSRWVGSVLRRLDLVPLALWHALVEAGLQGVLLADHSVPGFPGMEYLRGTAPIDWPKGKTWDDVAGTYDPPSRRLLLGKGEHGSVSMALHETGHAVAWLLNYKCAQEVEDAQNKNWHELDHYYKQQRGKCGQGCDELWAETVACVLMGVGGGVPYDLRFRFWVRHELYHPVIIQ